MSLLEPTLVVYLFATVTGEDPDRAATSYQRLRHAWQTAAKGLHLDKPAAAHLPPDPDPKPPNVARTALLAGRQGPGRLRQMWWQQVHDVAVISLALSADTDTVPDEHAWQYLHTEWKAVADTLAPGQILGSAQVYTARTTTAVPLPVGTDEASSSKSTTTVLEPLLPEQPAEGWQDSATVTRTGVVIYQLSPRTDQPTDRQLVVLAPRDRDGELGAWVWQDGLGRLPMYLLNAAKLRHQASIIAQQRPAISDLRLSTYQQLNQLQALMYGTQKPDIDQLVKAEVDITAMQAQTDGLIDTQARIETFQRTIDIAAANITTLTNIVVDPARRPLIDDDHALAQRISADLDDDHTFLAAVTTRAQHVATAATARISQHRDERERTTQHRDKQYGLLQTGILTAIVTALTTIQALGYKVTAVPTPAQPAIIALLAAITLLLYTIPLHHGEQANAKRTQTPPRRWPTRLLVAAAALTGATTGWTTATFLRTHDVIDQFGNPGRSVILAAAGLILATAATAFGIRRSRRPAESPKPAPHQPPPQDPKPAP